jgi:hypothetical protein
MRILHTGASGFAGEHTDRAGLARRAAAAGELHPADLDTQLARLREQIGTVACST